VLIAVLGRLLCAAASVTLAALSPAPSSTGFDWTADLARGRAVHASTTGGILRAAAPTALLTLPAHALPEPVGRVAARLSANVPAGAAARLLLRGRLPDGRWTPGQTLDPAGPARLPGPARLVQVRVLLTGVGGARAEVSGLSLHAEPATELRATSPAAPGAYRVYATREGLVDSDTANGHTIGRQDRFVSLPSWRSLSDDEGGEYSVQVCSAAGRCAWAPVWDVGPWNTRDDYWSPDREQFPELPRGLPEAQAAFQYGHNDGEDGSGREVTNPAGIDLSDGIYEDLGLSGTPRVSVRYLWTGPLPLSMVRAGGHRAPGEANQLASLASQHADDDRRSVDGPGEDDDRPDEDDDVPDEDNASETVTVRTAPSDAAPAAGVAADHAGVPVECSAGNGWLRIGPAAWVPADTVELADDVPVGPCAPAPPAAQPGRPDSGRVTAGGRTGPMPDDHRMGLSGERAITPG
jgi:hypothetical protein